MHRRALQVVHDAGGAAHFMKTNMTARRAAAMRSTATRTLPPANIKASFSSGVMLGGYPGSTVVEDWALYRAAADERAEVGGGEGVRDIGTVPNRASG